MAELTHSLTQYNRSFFSYRPSSLQQRSKTRKPTDFVCILRPICSVIVTNHLITACSYRTDQFVVQPTASRAANGSTIDACAGARSSLRYASSSVDRPMLYYRIAPPPRKVPPTDNLPAKIPPVWRPPGRGGFLPVICRPGETLLGGAIP